MILTVTMNPSVDRLYKVNGFKIGSVHRVEDVLSTAGGKGLNVARVVKCMEEEVIATGVLGGANGVFIRIELDNAGIRHRFVDIYGDTRNCINIVDNNRSTEILESGPVLSKDDLDRFMNEYDSLLDEVSVVTLSGSLPKGVSSDFYKLLIERANAKDKLVLLDASKDALVEGLKVKPYVVKPNEDELEFFNVGVVDFLRSCKTQGVALPIVSLGKEGSIAYLEDGIYQFKYSFENVVNTVGSGDSFIAGVAIGLDKGMSQMDTLKLATATGAINTQFIETGFVDKAKVEELIDKVEVTKLD